MSDIEKSWKGHQFDWLTMAEQDTEANYYVCLNQREMAMLIGALAPTQWRTRWLNLPEEQSLDWIDELRGKLLCNNGCCDGVEECIKGSEGIREIIREIIKETTIDDPTRPLGEGNPALAGCNPDVIFGGVTSLVDILNQSILDTLEIIEVATNPLESLNLIADNNPLSGLLASKLIEMIDWIIANIGENYAANYTIGLRDTYRCDLFCIWQNNPNCELTTADVALYFQSRVASAPSPLMDISEVLAFIFGGVWIGPEIVDIMHLMCLTLMTAADRVGWLPIGNGYGVELAIAVGLNNPDADWAILCDECTVEPIPCVTFEVLTNVDFLIGSLDLTDGNPQPCARNASGVNSATYPLGGSGSNTGVAVAVKYTFTEDRDIFGVSFDYLQDHSVDTTVGFVIKYLDSVGTELYSSSTLASSARNVWHTRTHNHEENGVRSIVVAVFRTSTPAITGTILLDNICVDVGE